MQAYKFRGAVPDEIASELSPHSPFLQHLLFHRGVLTKEGAADFLEPDYGKLHDPFLMKDMDKAAERIIKAIKDNERIAIYSDYDADGIPGGVIMHDFFKKIGFDNFENYIPDRHDEGFGLNHDALEELLSRGMKVLITVDCGIADAEEVARIREGKVDVIITDHHLPSEKLPEAFAILNPKQNDCLYPEKMLCGSGVVFKLIQALMIRLVSGRSQSTSSPSQELGTIFNGALKIGWEKWLLDMVGLATLSDMVPLVGENRILAHFGLKVMRRSPRPGRRR